MAPWAELTIMEDYWKRHWRMALVLITLVAGMLFASHLSLVAQTTTAPLPAPKTQEARVVAVSATPTPTPTPTPAFTWRDNPNHCNEQTQWIAKEPPFTCINKPQPTVAKATPRPQPVVSRPAPQVGNWDALLQQHFGSHWAYAKHIMLCESSGNAHAVGQTDSKGYQPIGLFQIKNFPGRPTTQALFDGATNIAYAAQMTGGGMNWSAWECK